MTLRCTVPHMPKIFKLTMEIAYISSQVTKCISHFCKIFFQGPERKFLVNESNTNNMVVSILIYLYSVTDFMHGGFITCDAQMKQKHL